MILCAPKDFKLCNVINWGHLSLKLKRDFTEDRGSSAVNFSSLHQETTMFRWMLAASFSGIVHGHCHDEDQRAEIASSPFTKKNAEDESFFKCLTETQQSDWSLATV